LLAIANISKYFQGQSQRPDLEAILSSGLFDECVSAVHVVAAAGAQALHDTNIETLFQSIRVLIMCRAQTGCEAKIRSIAPALAFCLEHDIDYIEEMGSTIGSVATELCCGVFGRDEGGSEFTFTSQHIDTILTSWSQTVRGEGVRSTIKPSADRISVDDVCVSDHNKSLLLAHPNFLPYLVDALLLDPAHPRANLNPEIKMWCQSAHSEALAQVAVFPEGEWRVVSILLLRLISQAASSMCADSCYMPMACCIVQVGQLCYRILSCSQLCKQWWSVGYAMRPAGMRLQRCLHSVTCR
jgi:hypothetical protein